MQTRQLAGLLAKEGVMVDLVATNSPYQPSVIANIRGLRALFRLVPYIWRIWRLASKVDVIHLMANSGWSWQLFAAPVIWVGWLRKVPVIVNYRGGEARDYLQRSTARVKLTMGKAACVVVPSGFLSHVFGEFGISTKVIPNIIDLDTFHPRESGLAIGSKQPNKYVVVITRNLEPIYGVDSAIRCIALVRESIPGITLKIAGSGPQLSELQQLVASLGLEDCVSFLGRLERSEIVALYQLADVMLNPSLVDNMPNSVLESLACGVPVISTDVGGVSYLVENEATALLVPAGDVQRMAHAVKRLYSDERLRANLASAGLAEVEQYSWSNIGGMWRDLYSCCATGRTA